MLAINFNPYSFTGPNPPGDSYRQMAKHSDACLLPLEHDVNYLLLK